MLFTLLQDNFVITHSKGVFHQKKVYRRGDALYISQGSGFLRLTRHGCTGPNISIDEKIFTFTPEIDALGYLKLPKNFNVKKGK